MRPDTTGKLWCRRADCEKGTPTAWRDYLPSEFNHQAYGYDDRSKNNVAEGGGRPTAGARIRSFLRSLPPSRRAAAWGWPSAVPLWNRMAGSCGQAPTVQEAQLFISPCRPMCGSHRLSSLDGICGHKAVAHGVRFTPSVGDSAALLMAARCNCRGDVSSRWP